MQNQGNKSNHEVASAIIHAIVDNDGELRLHYCGRGMYGQDCIGYTIDHALKSLVLITSQVMESDLSDSEKDQAVRILSNANMDNMGLSSIVYFRQLQWTEELGKEFAGRLDDEEEDEDDEN
jgi:hypothetical protein